METILGNKKLRAAIYLRVSTDEQKNRGYGLEVQDDKLRAYIKMYEYVLDEKHVYKDEGYSGTLPVKERPGLEKLLQAAQNHEFDVVIVYRLDRIFRKAIRLLEVLEDFEKFKIGFKSVTEAIDTTTHTGKFVITCLGGIAEMERETIRERTTSGRIKAARAGKWVTGVPPYGFNLIKDTGQLEINTEEAKWVRQFFRWIVTDRMSLREVQQKANDLKIPIPRRKVSEKKTLNYWHKRTLGRILTNENYTGMANFRKYKRPFKNLTSIIDESQLREKEDWISIKVPAIISPELFERCKHQLTRNRDFSKRNQKRTYMFSKIVYCGACGFKLFGGFQPSKKEGNQGSKYYHGVCSKEQVGTTKRCETCEQISEARLIPIWDRLKEILKKPQIALEKLVKYNEDKDKDKDAREQLEQVRKARDLIKEKRPRLALLFSEGELERDVYKKVLLECKAQDQGLEQEELRLERQLIGRSEIKDIAKVIDAQYKKLVSKIDSLDYDGKQEVLRMMLKRIIVYPKKGEAEMELSFNPGQAVLSSLHGLPIPSYANLWDNSAGRVSGV